MPVGNIDFSYRESPPTKIHTAYHNTNYWHKDVFDERRDNLPEGSTNNDCDREVYDIASHGEGFEFFNKSFHKSMS